MKIIHLLHSLGGKQSLLFSQFENRSIAARLYRSGSEAISIASARINNAYAFFLSIGWIENQDSLSARSRFLFFFRHGRLCFFSIIKGKARLYARLYFNMPLLSPRSASQYINDENYSGFRKFLFRRVGSHWSNRQSFHVLSTFRKRP
jgi:hypothetical protein